MRRRLPSPTLLILLARSSLPLFVLGTFVAASPPLESAEPPASPSCTFDAASAIVEVNSAVGVRLRVGPAGEILVNGAACDGATVDSTDVVRVIEEPGLNDGVIVTIDLGGGAFAPGRTGEGTSSDEIEFELVLTGFLRVIGSEDADAIVAGEEGVNLNAVEDDGIDADVSISVIPPWETTGRTEIFGRGGSDRLEGRGGEGTGARVSTVSLRLYGGDDDDLLVGGDKQDGDVLVGDDGRDRLWGMDGHDGLRGGAGQDELRGGSGYDRLAGDDGADLLDGGTHPDLAIYDSAPRGVRVDLRIEGPQVTRGGGRDELRSIQNLVGSHYDDVLIGDRRRNLFGGRRGDDILRGLGGNDVLSGDPGDDLLNGGPGLDRCDTGAGEDIARACERPRSVYGR